MNDLVWIVNTRNFQTWVKLPQDQPGLSFVSTVVTEQLLLSLPCLFIFLPLYEVFYSSSQTWTYICWEDGLLVSLWKQQICPGDHNTAQGEWGSSCFVSDTCPQLHPETGVQGRDRNGAFRENKWKSSLVKACCVFCSSPHLLRSLTDSSLWQCVAKLGHMRL